MARSDDTSKLKIKGSDYLQQNSSFKAYDGFDIGLSAFILKSEIWIHFVLREQSRGVYVPL